MVCVLVVEDDVQFNKIICSHLSNSGYTVVGCSSGADAIAQLEKMSFDIIVSDVMMKGMDGFEFARQARLIDDNIPIIFLTARDDMNSKEVGYKIGIDDYIVNPEKDLIPVCPNCHMILHTKKADGQYLSVEELMERFK
jgi:DNA-binding response OmpR family regulator